MITRAYTMHITSLRVYTT